VNKQIGVKKLLRVVLGDLLCTGHVIVILRMRPESEKVFRQKSYSPVTGNGGRRSERRGQIFDRKLVNRRFCACAVKNGPKTRLSFCQIAKILAPLWAIAVAEHDGI